MGPHESHEEMDLGTKRLYLQDIAQSRSAKNGEAPRENRQHFQSRNFDWKFADSARSCQHKREFAMENWHLVSKTAFS